MKLKRLVTVKLLAASTFGLYLFDFRKAWADELPDMPVPPAIVQMAELPVESLARAPISTIRQRPY